MISHWMEDEGRKVQRTFGDVVPELGEVLNCEEEEKKTRQFVVEKVEKGRRDSPSYRTTGKPRFSRSRARNRTGM